MKRLITAWAGRTRAARRLAAGSSILAARQRERLIAWIRAGRREDLTGWRAVLGPLLRLAVLAGAAWLACQILRALPWLMWALTGWWCWAAWRAAPPSAEDPKQDGSHKTGHGEHSAAEHDRLRAALARWLDEATRDRAGIHLSDLYARLRARPALAHLTDPQMRRMLDHFEVGVDRTLRVGRISGRTGVRRSTIEQLLEDLPGPLPDPAPHPRSPHVESDSDLRESTRGGPTPDPSQKGSGVDDTDLGRHFGSAIHLTH